VSAAETSVALAGEDGVAVVGLAVAQRVEEVVGLDVSAAAVVGADLPREVLEDGVVRERVAFALRQRKRLLAAHAAPFAAAADAEVGRAAPAVNEELAEVANEVLGADAALARRGEDLAARAHLLLLVVEDGLAEAGLARRGLAAVDLALVEDALVLVALVALNSTTVRQLDLQSASSHCWTWMF